MPRFSPFRLLLAATLPIAAAAQLPSPPASTLPASRPTTQATLPTLPNQPAATQPTPNQPTPDQSAHRARITWNNNQLSVTADNSSLNQILREISRQTGMKITGGVHDERVFGSYGPAETGSVLATLLTGTGSNMLLKEARNDQPLELVLTPRQGGPTPPSPASFQRDEDSDQADAPPQRFNQRERPPMPMPPPTNIQSATQQVSDQTQQPATTPSDSQSTGVRTPQQIYDQLMKLQQQKATTPPQD